MAFPRKRRDAFTLTEMLMAAGILGIGLTMVASIFPVAVDQSRRSRDLTMAAAFGGHPAVAAFFVAFRFANLPRRLLGEGAMHSAFVPRFEALRREDPARAAAFSARPMNF